MAYKTCDDCGSRIFEHGCVNCNEQDYIDMQGDYHNQIAKNQPTKTVTMVDGGCGHVPPLPLPFDGCKKLPMAETKLIDENGRQLGSPIIELDEDGKIIGRKLK